MGCVRTCLILFVVLTFVDFHQCGRFGGSRGGGFSRGSSSSRGHSPSYHAPSYHAPSYHAPAYRPPSYSPPAYHAPSYNRPRPSPPPRHNPSPRPNPPAYQPATRVTSRPVNQHPTSRPAAPTSRPNYPAGPTSRPNYPTRATSRPNYPTRATSRPNINSGTNRPPLRQSTARPVNFNNLPPRPGHGPVGPPRYGYNTGSGYHGPQQVKIVNKYNYHYPGYYSLPVQHYSYPGYFYTPSYYHYNTHDTGSTALGFYLGYSLARLSTPTYSHYSFYDGYRPRYDHYEVHHYYHNKEAVPQQQVIQPNTIMGCVGDSVNICPANTTSLCTSNGALMCVVSAKSTAPCANDKQANCVTSTISCVNNTGPECKGSTENTTISIPCISKAQVYGNITYVNNTIIVYNGTNTTTTNNNSTTITKTINGTVTTSSNNSTVGSTDSQYSTKYPITTTPVPVPAVVPESRKKRDVAQDFCVTIVALPAKRKMTEGEQFLNDAKFLSGKFFESAWHL